MPVPLKMPQLGLTMTEGKITRWLKQEGDSVEADEALLEIETDKINAEVEAPASGRLTHVQAQAGDSVKVIGLLAIIAAPEDTDADLAAAVEAANAAAERGTAASQAVATAQPPRRPPPRARPQRPGRPAPPAAAGGRVMASPVARRLARELEVDLSTVTGTGPRGRIVESDVRAAAEASAAAPAAPAAPAPAEATGLTTKQVIPVSGIRQVIGERMSTSLRDMAQLTIFTEADATALRDRRASLAQEAADADSPRPTYNDLIVWHLARTLADHPLLNASMVGEKIHCWEEINIGVAVALDSGLIVPVVRAANTKSLTDLAGETADLADRARTNRLSPDELLGGTFTITNLGTLDVDGFTPIINPPQSAILGVGRIVPRPVVAAGEIAVRYMVTLSLSFDHRIVDGAPAAQFLQALKQAIEQG